MSAERIARIERLVAVRKLEADRKDGELALAIQATMQAARRFEEAEARWTDAALATLRGRDRSVGDVQEEHAHVAGLRKSADVALSLAHRAKEQEAKAREDAQHAHRELKKLERLVEGIAAASADAAQKRERRELDELAARVSSASRISGAPRPS